MLIYLAAPLFTEAERQFNLSLAARLEAAGYKVFLPQRDAPLGNMSQGYASRIFGEDLEGLTRADIVVAVCDGIPMDDGAAWEVGYAYGRGIPVIGLRTDSRVVGPEERVNLMIQESLTALVGSTDDVLTKLRELNPPA